MERALYWLNGETIIMKNDKKILFVTEKWVDADPSKGLTNNYHNLFKSFSNTFPDNRFGIIHYDEYSSLKKNHIDNFLIKTIKKKKPDLIIFSLLGKSELNPTEKSFETAKEEGCKSIFIWPDIGVDWGMPEINKFNDKGWSDFHVCWGREKNVRQNHKNLLWLWAPQDEKLYHPADGNFQDISISFLGSKDNRYQERIHYLKYLQDNGIDCVVGGGQREKRLSTKQYADIMRRSKISLNFPFCPSGFDQCKGRVWEILASRSLLFERKNEATEGMLEPGTHYVEYTSPQDLVEKYHYYINNEDERKQIAQNGYDVYYEKYSAKCYWEQVMRNI
jgi:hypothetical protein